MKRKVLLLSVVIGMAYGPRPLVAQEQSTAALRQRGIQAFNAKDYAQAKQIFSVLVQKEPSAINYDFLANSEAMAGDLDGAIAHFQRSFQLGNNTAGLHYNLGVAYSKKKKFALAVPQFQAALASRPDWPEAKFSLGRALLGVGKAREALPYFEQLVKESPTNDVIWTNLVRAQFEAGESKQALDSIDKASEAIPNNTLLIYTFAQLAYEHGEIQKARYLLENVIELMPHNDVVKLLLAEVSLDAHAPVEAVAVLKDVPENTGTPGQVAYLRGRALMLSGKTTEAGPLLAAAVAAKPSDPDYLLSYAEFELAAGEYNEAVSALDKAHAVRPKSAQILYQRALTYLFMHRYTDADASCDQAMRLAPKVDMVYCLSGIIKLRQQRFSQGEEAFHHAIALKTDSALYHIGLGVALFKEGKMAESKQELDRALQLDARISAGYFWRARVYASQNQHSQAISDLQTFVALAPDFADAYKQLGELYIAAGDTAKASVAESRYEALEKSGQKDNVVTLERALLLQ